MRQETLEEFAERLCPNKQVEYDMIIEGVKWQQERSYSEEDMKSFADWCRNGLLNTEYNVDRLNKHLEQWKQFKK